MFYPNCVGIQMDEFGNGSYRYILYTTFYGLLIVTKSDEIWLECQKFDFSSAHTKFGLCMNLDALILQYLVSEGGK